VKCFGCGRITSKRYKIQVLNDLTGRPELIKFLCKKCARDIENNDILKEYAEWVQN